MNINNDFTFFVNNNLFITHKYSYFNEIKLITCIQISKNSPGTHIIRLK